MTQPVHYPLDLPRLQSTPASQLAVHAPYDGRLLGTVALADADAVEQALSLAAAQFADRSQWLSKPARIRILQNAIALIRDQAEDLIHGAASEGGKPWIDSEVELHRCIDSLQHCVDVLRHQTPRPVAMGLNAASLTKRTLLDKEPRGVVVALSAFNHPLNLIAHQVGPAIAAGCPVIIKPAETTPLSCFRLVAIFRAAGLPADWCRVLVTESHAVTEALIRDPRIAFMNFIGSARVGWMLRSKLAPGVHCALEHGGVAPVVILPDADLSRAVPGLAKGAFYHAGQVCVSVQRIFVHRSRRDDLLLALKTAAQQMPVGDPLDPNTQVGPLIRAEEVARVDAWVQEALAEGAQLICGGQAMGHQCYAPTILLNPAVSAKVSCQEVFGPVVCVYDYESVDTAIAEANRLDYAFHAAVYGQDLDATLAVADALAASAVMINEHTAFRVDWMPFAGLRHSGLGVGGIEYAIEDLQVTKMLIINSPTR